MRELLCVVTGVVMAYKTLVLCILFYIPERTAVPLLLLMMYLKS